MQHRSHTPQTAGDHRLAASATGFIVPGGSDAASALMTAGGQVGADDCDHTVVGTDQSDRLDALAPTTHSVTTPTVPTTTVTLTTPTVPTTTVNPTTPAAPTTAANGTTRNISPTTTTPAPVIASPGNPNPPTGPGDAPSTDIVGGTSFLDRPPTFVGRRAGSRVPMPFTPTRHRRAHGVRRRGRPETPQSGRPRLSVLDICPR